MRRPCGVVTRFQMDEVAFVGGFGLPDSQGRDVNRHVFRLCTDDLSYVRRALH